MTWKKETLKVVKVVYITIASLMLVVTRIAPM